MAAGARPFVGAPAEAGARAIAGAWARTEGFLSGVVIGLISLM
jgi:hypothetical protein